MPVISHSEHFSFFTLPLCIQVRARDRCGIFTSGVTTVLRSKHDGLLRTSCYHIKCHAASMLWLLCMGNGSCRMAQKRNPGCFVPRGKRLKLHGLWVCNVSRAGLLFFLTPLLCGTHQTQIARVSTIVIVEVGFGANLTVQGLAGCVSYFVDHSDKGDD
ncbi:hypothetical protein HDV62DRAFT_365657 [Trichoderma sp. SZMC 28011]